MTPTTPAEPVLVDLIVEDPRWEEVGLEALADRAAAATLERLGLEPSVFAVSLLACDDARIAALNAEFRDRESATNVLSWPSEERGAWRDGEMPAPPECDPMGETELGDVAIAWETCTREAEVGGKPLTDHATHLVVHAVLHLLGYDHERDLDAALMEGLEVEILGKLGCPDPYGSE